MATMRDLAEYTNLSLGTVSKFINGGLVKPKNRILLEQAVHDLDYEINDVARSLKMNRTNSFGILLPVLNIHNISIVEKLLNICTKHGYSTMIACTESDLQSESNYVNFMAKKNVDGIFFFPSAKNVPVLDKIKRRNIPVVVLDYYFEDAYCDFVLSNNRSAGRWGAEQLLQKGHRNIVFLVGPQQHYTAQERLKGCQAALRVYGMQLDPNLVLFTDYSVADAYVKLNALLDRRKDITGIFATNYNLAQASYMVLRERGMHIPDDISVVVYDNLDFTKIVEPKPYVIDQPIQKMAEAACEIMFKRVEKKIEGEGTIRMFDTVNIPGQSIRMINKA